MANGLGTLPTSSELAAALVTSPVVVFPSEYATDDDSIWFTSPHDENYDVYTVVYRNRTEVDPPNDVLFDAMYGDFPSMIRCCCTACWSVGTSLRNYKSETHMKSATRNYENKHCASCKCHDCVCDFKAANGMYETSYVPADGYFDNFCGGECVLCTRFKP